MHGRPEWNSSFLAGNDSWLSPEAAQHHPRIEFVYLSTGVYLGLLAGKIRKELKELDNIIAYCAKQTDEIVLTALMHGSIKVQ